MFCLKIMKYFVSPAFVILSFQLASTVMTDFMLKLNVALRSSSVVKFFTSMICFGPDHSAFLCVTARKLEVASQCAWLHDQGGSSPVSKSPFVMILDREGTTRINMAPKTNS